MDFSFVFAPEPKENEAEEVFSAENSLEGVFSSVFPKENPVAAGLSFVFPKDFEGVADISTLGNLTSISLRYFS